MTGNNVEKRKYFEVFGDTINTLVIFKTIAIFLLMAVIFQLIIIRKLINKPPLVIRVDSLGSAAAYKDVPVDQAVSPVEVSNFSQIFLQYFMAHNFYTYDDDFKKAFKMMSANCQQKLNDYITVHNVVEEIKANQIKSKLNISEIITVKDSREFVNLKIKGSNEISSYENSGFFREEVFEVELSLKKLERSIEFPFGLVVDSWNVSYFKK